MAVKPLSRKLAEQALASIKEQYKSYLMFGDEEFGPKLVESWTDSGHWAIVWEEGPYEWALNSPQGGVDEELSELAGQRVDTPEAPNFPEGVFAECYSYSVLCLYPNHH